MNKRVYMILALATLVMLFSGMAFAAEAPKDTETPIQEPSPAASADVQDPEAPEESEEPADPGEFRDDLFSDVENTDWFFDNVKNAYELGLMKGRGEGVFAPLDSIELAEAITIADRLRSAWLGDGRDFSSDGEPWYASVVDYAVAQGIIQEGEFSDSDYTSAATRAQFAYVLSGALPSGALEEMNTVEDDSLPDVKTGDAYAENIYTLYRVGILLGNDEKGTFNPSGTITRAEAAAMASRVANPDLRVRCEFYAPVPDPKPAYPDLPLRERADDSFFSDTAILGNSLIDGLKAYSKLKTVDFYCATSMSVVSAMNKKDVRLNNGTYGTQLDALAQKQYGKIYIELGINEIGGSVNTYISRYRTMLDRIRATQPNAEIYIMAITPVSKAKSDAGTFTRERVITYNKALYNLAAEWGCYYLDDFTPLADSNGYLPSSASWDGVHLVVSKYAEWETIIRTHYA